VAAPLRVVPIGPLPAGAAEGLATRLGEHGFAVSVEATPSPRIASLVAPAQERLDAHFALAALRREPSSRVLGLTAAELKDDSRPTMYGLAEMNGRVAVFSTRPFYQGGLSPAEALDRLTAAVLHELAHTLGMVHCRHRGCLMNATHEPAVLRRLQPRFCDACAGQWSPRVARSR